MSPMIRKPSPAPISDRWFTRSASRTDAAYQWSGQAGNSIAALSEEELLELMFEPAELYS